MPPSFSYTSKILAVANWLLALVVALAAVHCTSAQAIDYVDCKQEGKTTHLSGKTIVQAQDGGVLLLAPDGHLWTLQPEQILAKRHDDQTWPICPPASMPRPPRIT
jgi:hypothetical protein